MRPDDILVDMVYCDEHGESIMVTSIDVTNDRPANYDRVRWATYADDIPRRTGETTRARFARRMKHAIGWINTVDAH